MRKMNLPAAKKWTSLHQVSMKKKKQNHLLLPRESVFARAPAKVVSAVKISCLFKSMISKYHLSLRIGKIFFSHKKEHVKLAPSFQFIWQLNERGISRQTQCSRWLANFAIFWRRVGRDNNLTVFLLLADGRVPHYGLTKHRPLNHWICVKLAEYSRWQV